jgi:gamma-glutamylcyclotransferase (GGCT)/AIG2-like uncharacterized protein YtfP
LIALPHGTMTPGYLFVYGTLRRGASADLSLQYPDNVRWLRHGWVLGQLFQVSYYPGLVLEATGNRIVGDLFELLNPDLQLACLDDFEGCSERFPMPHEYQRQMTEIFSDSAPPLPAWVYVYHAPTHGLDTIPSGNFLKSEAMKTGQSP